MAAKRKTKAIRKVKALPTRSLSAKHAKAVKGGLLDTRQGKGS